MIRKILDLYCCAGGAAMGYHRAGFEVTGIDVSIQPEYPFEFIQGDVLTMDFDWSQYDAIHASPPCQALSNITGEHRAKHDDLIPQTRELLESSGLPYIIENVVGAPLVDPIRLCGRSFPGLRVYRHRLFESNFPLVAPPHQSHDQLCYTLDKRKPHYGRLDDMTAFVQVTGGGNSSKAAAADAMGINWMRTKKQLNESIPPAYTEFLGRQLVTHLETVKA